jgi:hypothetical protein
MMCTIYAFITIQRIRFDRTKYLFSFVYIKRREKLIS